MKRRASRVLRNFIYLESTENKVYSFFFLRLISFNSRGIQKSDFSVTRTNDSYLFRSDVLKKLC